MRSRSRNCATTTEVCGVGLFRHTMADIRRAKQVLGWEPQVDLVDYASQLCPGSDLRPDPMCESQPLAVLLGRSADDALLMRASR